jgi:hypothetical protein
MPPDASSRPHIGLKRTDTSTLVYGPPGATMTLKALVVALCTNALPFCIAPGTSANRPAAAHRFPAFKRPSKVEPDIGRGGCARQFSEHQCPQCRSLKNLAPRRIGHCAPLANASARLSLSLGNFNVVHRYIGFNLFETSQGFIPPFKAAVSGTAAGAHGFPFSDQLPAMFVDSGSRRAKIWRTGEKVLSIKSSVRRCSPLKGLERRVTAPAVAPAAENKASPEVASSKGSQAEW